MRQQGRRKHHVPILVMRADRRLQRPRRDLIGQLVSEGFDRDDGRVEERDLELQPADMYVDGSGGAVVVIAPYRIQEHIAGQHSARVVQELFEQSELFCGQENFFAVDRRFVSREIHP